MSIRGDLLISMNTSAVVDVYASRAGDDIQLKVQRVWLASGRVDATLKVDTGECRELARSAWGERPELWSVALMRWGDGWRCEWASPASVRGYWGPIASYAELLDEGSARFKNAEVSGAIAQAKRLSAAQQAWLRSVWGGAACGAEGELEVIAWPSGRMMVERGERAVRACLEPALKTRQGPTFDGRPTILEVSWRGGAPSVSGVSSCGARCTLPDRLPSSRRLMASQLWKLLDDVELQGDPRQRDGGMGTMLCMLDGYNARYEAWLDVLWPNRKQAAARLAHVLTPVSPHKDRPELLRLCALRWGREEEVVWPNKIGVRLSHNLMLSTALARWSGEDIVGLFDAWTKASRDDERALIQLFADEQSLPLELRFSPRFLEARARVMLWLEPKRREDARSLLQLAVWLAASSEVERHQRALDALGPGEAPAASRWKEEREEWEREGERIAARYKELMLARVARVEGAREASAAALKAALRQRDEEERRITNAQRAQAHERRSSEGAGERARLGWMVLAVAVAAVILIALLVRREGRR